jgi:large subunit ribosomal protein L29
MDIDSVRNLTDTELLGELVTQRRALYDLRFQLATRQLTDHSQLTQTRRSIARILTVITERGLDENEMSRVAAPAPARGRGARRTSARKPSAEAKKADSSKSTAKSETGGKS